MSRRSTRQGRILVGTASWTDRSLVSSGWYPEGTSSAEERLGYYASRFPLVEVDSTYYFLPRREVARRWVERTPAGFTLDVKAFSLLTQHPTQPDALPEGTAPSGKQRIYLRHLDRPAVDEVWKQFKRGLAPLEKAGKLGAILFQFPPWFTIKSVNKEYILECAKRAAPLRISVELRSPTWLRNKANREETLGFLAEHRLPYVWVDQPKQAASSKAAPVTATSPDLAVVRFHGRGTGRSGAQPEAAYSYPTRVLSAWVPKLLTLAQEARTVHAVFRNAHRDFAPRNAEQLQRLLSPED